MPSTSRRVAVIGGNRIPFARSNTVYADASNQEMLTAAHRRSRGRATASQGERVGEVVAGAVLKHSPRLQPDPRVGARLEARRPRPRRTTSSRPATPASRPPSRWPTRSPSARSRSASPAAPTPPRTRRSRSTRSSARSCSRPTAPRTSRAGWPRWPRCAPAPRAVDPAEQRAAHRPVDGRARRAHRAGVEASTARSRTSSPSRSHHNLAAAYDVRLPGRPVTPFRGLERDQNLRADSIVEKLGHAQAGLRQGRDRHDDRRQLHAADRRRLGRAAGLGGVGEGARPAGAGVPHGLRDRRGRLRARRRGPADGAGVRDAADARARRPDACRTSTSTRSTRRSPRRCWPRSRRGRTRSSARSGSVSTPRSASIDRDKLNVQRLVARGGSPVRRDRRPDHRHAGQAARREGLAAAASSRSAPPAARASPPSSSASRDRTAPRSRAESRARHHRS